MVGSTINRARFDVIAVPYSSIDLPLNLLSAYLLLSKPRMPASKKISDPIPVDGA
jgi:hypothetical protein